ncbi:unnamed protein product [Merluccius merluccius]
MASSVVQLFGFLVAVGGLAATIAATCMAEWSTHESGNGRHEFYEGLWGECSVSGSTRMTCDAHDSLMDVPWKVQVTRAMLISSMFLSSLAVLVSIGGMKCTRFMDDRDESKRCMTLCSVRQLGGVHPQHGGGGLLNLSEVLWDEVVHVTDHATPDNHTRY